jgi:thiamine-phosphate pyrophosphorylase
VNDREKPILCYVTDRRSLSALTDAAMLADKIASIAAAGVDWVQIREKDLSGRALAELTREAIARKSATRIIVNDRVDVAVTEEAGGVHLGETGLPVADVAKWMKRTGCGAVDRDGGAAPQFAVETGKEFLVGASCHSLEAAKAAVRDGADYIFFGPVFATPSKAKFGEPQGVKKLAVVCSAVSVPVIAIGGIALENARECIAAGAAGIAAIRLFQDAAEPAQVISELKQLRR